MMPWQQAGTVSYGSVMGPMAGQAVAERASAYPMRKMRGNGQAFEGMMTLPVIIAMGVLVWYAVKSYG